MVARAEGIRARKLRHPPLEITHRDQKTRIDETSPSANRKSLVPVDAQRANVAGTRPLPVPQVRAAASDMLGATFTGRAGRDGFAARNAKPKQPCNGNRIEGPKFMNNGLDRS
jgi:hypothetical protein